MEDSGVNIISDNEIIKKIYTLRGKRVILDSDIARLYKVETKALKQQVRRNIERFPEDFMFELSYQDIADLRSQFVTSSWGGTRYKPMAFTEQGIAMLSSVLRSKEAIMINIRIIRLFTKMREIIVSNKDLIIKVDELEKKVLNNGENIHIIFEYFKKLLKQNNEPRKKIGFKQKGV